MLSTKEVPAGRRASGEFIGLPGRCEVTARRVLGSRTYFIVTVHGSGETSLQRGAGLRGVKQRGPSASSRPRLEALEDRLAPATTITINGTVTLDESPGLQNTGIPVGAEDNNDVVVHVVGYCGSRQSPSPRRQCSVGTKVTRTRPRSFVLAECLSCPLVRDALASVTSRL